MVAVGTLCRVSGWGQTEMGELSNVLMYVDLPIASDQKCIEKWGGGIGNNSIIVCTGGVNTEDSCKVCILLRHLSSPADYPVIVIAGRLWRPADM